MIGFATHPRGQGNRTSILAAAICVVGLGGIALAQDNELVIGTGGEAGVYFPTGTAICDLVNRNTRKHGLTCRAETSDGSIANVEGLRAGELAFGIVQSDVQYNAVRGSGPFEEAGPHDGLRFVFSVHPEPFTLLVRADSGINTFDDLVGRRVNIGNPGSGQRATMEAVMAGNEWDTTTFSAATELTSTEQGPALCADEIDAIAYTVGHPSQAIRDTLEMCEARLVDVTGRAIERLIREFPYYFRATIPAGMYNNDNDVVTFGVGATFVTTSDVDPDTVESVVASVLDNLDMFRLSHPAFGILQAPTMALAGRSAPYHEGAERYYAETGLLER